MKLYLFKSNFNYTEVRQNLESNPLSTRLAGLELENPTILASGILGYSAESLHRVAKGGEEP